MSKDRLKAAQKHAATYTGDVSVSELERMCSAADADTRLRGLFLVRRQIDELGPHPEYLELGRTRIDDPDNDCRWQALIVVGEFIETAPEIVWEVAQTYGQSEDDDMRMGVACVLLEHLLDQHELRYRSQVDELASQSPLFAETLSICFLTDDG